MNQISKVFQALENTRRDILMDSNDALDLIKALRKGKLSGLDSQGEVLEEIEKKLYNILINISQ